eukprot:COSAG06_NODE_3410_length_5383_cov_180.550530_11_plen_185_part_01
MYEAGEVSDASLPPYDHQRQQLQQDQQQVQQQKDDQQWQQQEEQQHGYASPRRTRLSLSPQKGQGQGGAPLLDGSYVVVDSEALLEEYRAHEQQERDYEQQQQQQQQQQQPLERDGGGGGDSGDGGGGAKLQVRESIAAVRAMMAAAADGGDISATVISQTVQVRRLAFLQSLRLVFLASFFPPA